MNLKNTGKSGVVIQYDNEDLAKMLVVTEHEAIELRDLLLREFPMEQPKFEAAWSDEVLAFNSKTYADDKARERRERIATAALAGMLTQTRRDPGIAASEAVEQADDLIRELDKEQP